MAERVFIARTRELDLIWRFLDRTLTGQGQVCLIAGEAGRGKTALFTEFALHAQNVHSDLLVVVGRCNAQTGIGDPYLPFREVLDGLTGDVDARLAQGAISKENARRLRAILGFAGQMLVKFGPDLINVFVPGSKLAASVGAFVIEKVDWTDRLKKLLKRKPSVPGELDQDHIFEQYGNVLKAIAEEQPLMLVLDDLQWADSASISLLFYLVRNLDQSRILLVGTYRPDEVALGRNGDRHPLEKVLTELKRYFGDVLVDLDQADDEWGRCFVNAYLDTDPNCLGEEFRQALFHHTRGHPLFTVELLQDMQGRGDIIKDSDGRWVEGLALDWDTLPARVEGVIQERIGRLEEEQRDVLSVASVEGQAFTAEVVAEVEEIHTRRLLRKLSQELEKRHRLVQEQGEIQVSRGFLSRYEFAHALFQQYLYNDLGSGERRMLHGEIAAVLEELYQEQTEMIAVELARHYTRAGMGAKAIDYLLRAGDRARGLFAYQEAIGFYQKALEFLKEQDEQERTARTWMKLGLTYHVALDFQRARQAYEEGFTLWQQVEETEAVASLPSAPHALRVGWLYPPLTLDPAMAADVDTIGVIDALFCGLVMLNPELEMIPDVARSWEVLDGGRKYVFSLCKNVRWGDNAPVTAEDFAYAWTRVLSPGTESPSASLLYDIRGARAFHQGEVDDPGSLGIQVLDEATLAIELERPTGYFLHLLACSICYPVPKHVVETLGPDWAKPDNIVTNGPFRLKAWNQEEELSLICNPTYHGRFGGNVERIDLYSLPESTRLEVYETDGLDVLFLWNTPEERGWARQRYAGDYLSVPWLTTMYAGFAASHAPFDDPRIRQAFALAVNREKWADEIMNGYFFPGTGGFVPPGMPGHLAGIGQACNPDKGRQLLAQAGYPEGQGFSQIELLTDEGHEPTSQYLVSQWQENLGVEVAVKSVDWAEFMDRMEKEPPHIFVGTWSADYPDPDSFLRGCDAIRWTRWQDETFRDLVEGAQRVTDQAKRIRMYQQADKMLVDDAVLIPFAYLRSHLLVKPWVRQLPTSAIKWWYWQDVILEAHD